MPITPVTVSYDIADILGVDYDSTRGRTKVYVSTNVPGALIVDTDSNQIRLDGAEGTVGTDGTGSVSVWPTNAATNPTAFQYYFTIDYIPRGSGKHEHKRLGPFSITASANLADLAQEQEVPPTYLSTVTALLDGYVDDAQTARNEAVAARAGIVGDLTATDSQVATLATPGSGSQFEGVLSATIADDAPARVTPTKHAPAFGLYFPEAEGAAGDGVTDDSAAIQAAFNALPQDGSLGGGTVYLSATQYRVNSQVVITKHGARLAGPGGYSTVINIGTGVAGAVFKWSIPASIIRGPQAENLVFAGATGTTAGAILMEGAYDQVVLRNIFVHGLRAGATGIKVAAPPAGASASVSQTLIAENCWVSFNATDSGTAWHLQKLQEATFIGCKGLGGGEGVGTAWLMEDCRGLSFYGSTAAVCEYGFDIYANTGSVVGYFFDGLTVEGVTNTLRTRRNSAYTISQLVWNPIRSQVAVAVAAGPMSLAGLVASRLDTQGITVTVASTCSQVHITTEDLTKVTDSGVDTTVITWRNATNGAYTVTGPLAVEAASGPETRLRARGRAGFYQHLWSASSGADNGYFLRYTPDGSTFQMLHFIEPDAIKQHWYVFNGSSVVESMRIERLPAASKTGFWLISNNGTTTQMQQVELGAADSGGTGYRMLRVAN